MTKTSAAKTSAAKTSGAKAMTKNNGARNGGGGAKKPTSTSAGPRRTAPPAPSADARTPAPIRRGQTPVASSVLDRFNPWRDKGGVAPFVPPSSRLGRARFRRRLERRGFVPLSPGRAKLRHRILPRTVIGICFMLLAFAVGAAFSGAAFYAYYDNRLAENEATVSRFVETFDSQFNDATSALDTLRTDAITDIRTEMVPLEGIVSDATAVINLPEQVGQSVWAVETRDDDGRAAVGSAFAVANQGEGTAFVTSYTLVSGNTLEPVPGIELVNGDQRIPARLWSWDVERDIAIVVVDAAIPLMEMANGGEQTATVGHSVYVMGGVGGRGATASPGLLLDQSRIGLQHTAAIGTIFVGGPLVDSDGRVIGVAAANYQPYGLDHGGIPVAPDVTGMCEQLLTCDAGLTEVAAEVSAAPEPEPEPEPEILANTDETEAETAEESTDADTDTADEPASDEADG